MQFDRGALVRLDEASVDTADTDGRHFEFATGGKDAGVDETAQHHRGGVDGALVGNATTLDHLRRHTEFFGNFSQLWSSTVHEHHAYAERVEDGDLFDDVTGRCDIAENSAACFDDECLALEEADVWRSSAERANDGSRVGAMHDHRE